MELASTIATISPLATAIVAIVAIAVSRISTRDVIDKDLRLKLWEKRADTYVEMIRTLYRQDPIYVSPAKNTAEAQIGKEIEILPVRMNSRKWEALEASIEAYSSGEVRQLYSIWKSTPVSWTWMQATCVMHFDQQKNTYPETKLKETENRQALRRARDELLLQVRAELDFRKRRLPKISIEMGEPYGIKNIEFVGAEPDDWSAPTHSYICQIVRAALTNGGRLGHSLPKRR